MAKNRDGPAGKYIGFSFNDAIGYFEEIQDVEYVEKEDSKLETKFDPSQGGIAF